MKLRTKTATILSGTIAALALLSYLFARFYLLTGYENQEKEYAYQNVQRAIGAVEGELREIRTVARENAARDDAYAFFANPDPRFVDKALPQESLQTSRLDVLAYIDLHGNVLAIRSGKEAAMNSAKSPNAEMQIVHLAGLVRKQPAPHTLTGVMTFAGGPMLVAAAPVLPSTSKGTPRGLLLCGRNLDGDELAILSKASGVSLTAFSSGPSSPQLQAISLDLPAPLTSNSAKADSTAEPWSLADVPVLIRPVDEQTMGGYFRLFDLEGRPSVILNTIEIRKIHAQATTALAAIIAATILGGLILAAAMMALLEVNVLAPIISLSQVVAGTGKRSNVRIQISGSDELAELARSINNSLNSVERSTESQRVAQDALRSAKEYAEKLIQTANAIVLGLDESQRVFTWNEVAEKMTGYSLADLKKRDWVELLIPPEQKLNVRREIEKLRRGGIPTSFESSIVTKSGEVRNIAWQNNILRNQDQAIGTISFGIDITLRKRMEEGLSRSEIAYRTLVEGAPYGIFRLAPNGKLLLANPALAKMLGFNSPAELLAATKYGDLLVNSEFCKQLLRETHSRTLSGEAKWNRLDGKEISVRLTGRSVQQDDSLPAYCEVFSEDVTDQQRLQEQFYQSQKMEAVGRLAGGVAHDFNNLLGVIIGYSDLILDQSSMEEKLRSKIEQIKKSGLRAAALTGQLLAYSRKQILQPRVLSLNASINDAQKMLNRLIGEDVELVLLLAQDLGAIKADPTQMDQIFLNLAVNARDAMPRGGKLTFKTENFSVYEAMTFKDFEIAPNQYVVLTVSDTGTGMDAETQARIFEPFFTTKSGGKGTGLGLATVYGIVKQSGGYVLCESSLDKGASFRVFFPRVQAQLEQTASKDGRKALPRGSETVLVAEDAESLRSLIHDFMSQLGYTVLQAANGSDAMYLAQNHKVPIDLLLTDIVMPGMSGRELAQNFVLKYPAAKVLYMSGYTDDTIVRHGIEEGAVALLTKPFTMEAIARKVREVLK
jgi:two-component system, cell cycle sensor histidine kinase and response regulator CckA